MNLTVKTLAVTAGIVLASLALAQQAPPGAPGGSGALLPFGGRGASGAARGPYAQYFAIPSYDKVPPVLPADLKPGGVLIYSKTNGFRNESSIQASDTALAAIAHGQGWPYFVTENAAVMNKEQLAKFKVVVWNNNSGDTLLPDQREAFKSWVENGGSYVGIHGAGGDPKDNPIAGSSLADWNWYIDSLVGVQFTGHSAIQPGDAHVEDLKSPITKGLPAVFRRTDEWYAFATNPRSRPGFHILITADEKSYDPGRNTMGTDHPLAWWHCAGKGHVFYSALGHAGMMYSEPVILQLYSNAMAWGLAENGQPCAASK